MSTSSTPLWQKIIATIGAILAFGAIAVGLVTGLGGDQPRPTATPEPALLSLSGCKL